MGVLNKGWSWTRYDNGSVRLCDASNEWEDGWEKLFDKFAGKKFADVRKKIKGLTMEDCIRDFELLKKRAGTWNVPPARDICSMGLAHR